MGEFLTSLAPGTLPQWGTFAGIVVMIGGLITVFIKGIPERIRAGAEAKRAGSDSETAIRNEYVEQLREFRDEVHGYRNDLQIMQIRLNKAESASRLRADRITNMTFIIRLLISELKRLDPKSVIVAQAEALLSQMLEQDLADNGPLAASSAAEKTVKAAQQTVAQLKAKGD